MSLRRTTDRIVRGLVVVAPRRNGWTPDIGYYYNYKLLYNEAMNAASQWLVAARGVLWPHHRAVVVTYE